VAERLEPRQREYTPAEVRRGIYNAQHTSFDKPVAEQSDDEKREEPRSRDELKPIRRRRWEDRRKCHPEKRRRDARREKRVLASVALRIGTGDPVHGRAPNVSKLSGERSGAERVRCSRGLGEAELLRMRLPPIMVDHHRQPDIHRLASLQGRLELPTPHGFNE
jgi:hypothetical protein